MKKILLLSAIFIFACSSEDSSNDDDNSIDAVLVERFELSFIDNDPNSSAFGEQYQSVYSYNYDGNKLTSIDLEFQMLFKSSTIPLIKSQIYICMEVTLPNMNMMSKEECPFILTLM